MISRKYLTLLAGTLAILVSLVVAGQRQASPHWFTYQQSGQVRILTPTLSGKPELCLTCHQGIEQISESHNVDAFGCVICHGGDRLSLDQDIAHSSLIGAEGNPGNPSAMSTVEVGCGGSDCHSGDATLGRDHIERVRTNLHTTYAGGINLTLDALGTPRGDTTYGLIAASDAAIAHEGAIAELSVLTSDMPGFSDLATFFEDCQTCHTTSAEPILETNYYRGSGCAACHVYYTSNGLYQGGDPTLPKDEPGHPATHQLTTAIASSTCNACHNRGLYDPATLTFTAEQFAEAPLYLPNSTHYAVCQYKLDCIDCHMANEVMGDGDLYPSQAEAVRIECRTCHGTLEEFAPTITLEDVNDLAFRRATLNPFYDLFLGNTVILGPDGQPMEHMRVEGEFYSIVGKARGTNLVIPQVKGSACEQQVDQQDAADCQECHSYDPANPN